ncbi:urease accessory protein UreD [Pseudonocardia humida]|uniref:Urease accessory protein UreD n=1 Tax=Pseudonocardia humida TaxID=2800819 RepID=A0ABT1A740_9PSEU|nr:urease accessory protein UreD [Pseudonocardia humida]MCO1658761.1 urease accessory protein UreD [Pseudonocardia humida]
MSAPPAAPTGRTALTAAATLRAEPAAGRPRLRWSQAWPVVIRATGADRVHLVHGAGGPLGGDDFSLDVEVLAGASLRVRSAAATLVQPGAAGGPARWGVAADVGAGGFLDWAPEATVVCDGATMRSRLRVRLDATAGAVLRELVVLGRHGERGGRHRGELLVDVAGEPLIAHTTELDGADEVLRGPGGTAGARAVGTLLVAGTAHTAPHTGTHMATHAVADAAAPAAERGGEAPGVRWAWTELAGPGRLLVAVGEPGAVGAQLDRQASAPARAQRS